MTNVKVKGARSSHDIDVLVTFTVFSQKIVWVIECKWWRSSIPKEKVLALQEIVQDVGADKGLLFSETSFQSGAVSASKNTNIVLTSLEDNQEHAESLMDESFYVQQMKKITELRKLIKDAWIDDLGYPAVLPGVEMDDAVSIDGTLIYLSHSLEKMLTEDFPINFSSWQRGIIRCSNQEQLAKEIPIELESIETKILEIIRIAEPGKTEILKSRKLFIKAVVELLIAGKRAIHINDLETREPELLAIVKKMKQVGNYAEKLKSKARGSIKKELHGIMRLLIDTVYLYLSQRTVDLQLWDEASEKILSHLREMEKIEKL